MQRLLIGWTEHLKLQALENIANLYSPIHTFIPHLNFFSKVKIEFGKKIIHILQQALNQACQTFGPRWL